MSRARVLRPGDEAGLERFLARHADVSMFLRSNLRRAGLVDRGAPYQGTYAAAFEGGEMVGAAAHLLPVKHETLEAAVCETFAHKGPRALEVNRAAFRAGRAAATSAGAAVP